MMSDKNLVWIDLEMTGLNIAQDVILEIATIITDRDLNIMAEGPSYVIHHSDQTLRIMGEYVHTMHTKSGLVAQVKSSNISLDDAYKQTLDFIKTYCIKNSAMLAGNSVWQDRLFLEKYMPEITGYLHYRLIDISSIKMLVRSWYPQSPYVEFKKPETHRAFEDIKQSVEELKHYRKYFFIA